MKKRALAFILFLSLFLPTVSAQAASPTVRRIKGDNRYLTALELMNTRNDIDTIYHAYGETFSDALAITGIVAQKKAAVALTPPLGYTRLFLNTFMKIQMKIEPEHLYEYVVGGENSIPEQWLWDLGDYDKRIAGKDRYETARLLLDQMENVKEIIVVNGIHFPDALAAGGYVDGSQGVLLTDGKTLTIPKKYEHLPVTIIGGERSVSKAIEEKYHAKRIAGKDRYETALLVAKASKRKATLLVDGTKYADALSSSTFACSKPASILLTSPNKLPNSVKEYLKTQKDITIIGGYDSVSRDVEQETKSLGK